MSGIKLGVGLAIHFDGKDRFDVCRSVYEMWHILGRHFNEQVDDKSDQLTGITISSEGCIGIVLRISKTEWYEYFGNLDNFSELFGRNEHVDLMCHAHFINKDQSKDQIFAGDKLYFKKMHSGWVLTNI